jgi:hypothetical protein
VSEFQRGSQPSECHATRATARLPGLNIEVVHRQSPAGDAEQISIYLQAMPSFEASGRFFGEAGPFAFWAEATRLDWLPWLEAARVAMLSFGGTPALPKTGADAPRSREPHAG